MSHPEIVEAIDEIVNEKDPRKPTRSFREARVPSDFDYMVVIGRYDVLNNKVADKLPMKYYHDWEDFMGAINYFTTHKTKRHNYYVDSVWSNQDKRRIKGQVYMCKQRFKNKIKGMKPKQVLDFMWSHKQDKRGFTFKFYAGDKDLLLSYIIQIIFEGVI